MKGPLRVLLVEDSPTDAKLVLRELERGGRHVESLRVETAPDMRDALSSANWDIVISDWSMPQFSALAALALLRTFDKEKPFIIVSGTVGEESAVEGMRHGAQDYLLKDRLARLGPAIDRELAERDTREARRHAENSLRKSEARFARLAESGIIAISIADVFGRVHEANDAYLAMVGHTRVELDDGVVSWTRNVAPESIEGDGDALEALKTTGVASPRERVISRKDGTRVHTLAGGAMLDYPMCIAFHVDLSDRVRVEEELHRTQQQLLHAQKMEAIGSLAGGVAHDFNNLLSVILSYATMLKDDLLAGDPMEESLEEIRLAGLHAAGLTRQLLAFSRRQRMRPTLVNVNEVVAQTENMLRRLIGEDVELVRIAEPALPSIFVDADQLSQVIMNLAVNSRDAMPAGGKLTIETSMVVFDSEFVAQHVDSRPGPHVMLAITDTGTGMDKATQARVFEPFFTTKEVGEGTGLGLSTVFGIVKQSGGTIWLYSEPGEGTAFRIYFPVAADDVIAELEVEVTTASFEGSETVLLVEDEPRVRSLATMILRRLGYNVLEAAGGGDALLICEQHPATIHLLLTDVVMPRMSGKQLAERLESIRVGMRVLYMSGYTANAMVRHGIVDSDVALLQKPFTPETLGRAVRNTMDAPLRPSPSSSQLVAEADA